jgi:hypothetical protein
MAQKYWIFGGSSSPDCNSEPSSSICLINRISFYQPRVVFGDPTFGQVFQALPARSIQRGLKFYW